MLHRLSTRGRSPTSLLAAGVCNTSSCSSRAGLCVWWALFRQFNAVRVCTTDHRPVSECSVSWQSADNQLTIRKLMLCICTYSSSMIRVWGMMQSWSPSSCLCVSPAVTLWLPRHVRKPPTLHTVSQAVHSVTALTSEFRLCCFHLNNKVTVNVPCFDKTCRKCVSR